VTPVRVLFVDDESAVLQALRRNLHGMRNEWTMEFASSGAVALEVLAANPVDVIVSDMRMPGMDGWHLLAEVKKRHPQTVRFILSGHADPVSIMRVIGTAHQYLTKPCDGAALQAAIGRTQELRRLLQSDRLAHLVGQVGALPSPPRAFQEILACLQRPAASIADAATIIARDVAMTANILKLVNSAFFGSRQPITTAERAVAYLGLDTLGVLVLGYGVFQSGVTHGDEESGLEQLWQHSLDTGLAARTVAVCEGLSVAETESAFLAGVLHDVGRVVFAARVNPAGCAPGDVQMHHDLVGAYLLGLWGFPTPIVEAVAFHHAPGPAAAARPMNLSSIIHVADRLVHERRARQPAALEHGLEPGFLQRRGIAQRWPEWMAAFDAMSQSEP
jgi:HD-like signal output (HDOD) protein